MSRLGPGGSVVVADAAPVWRADAASALLFSLMTPGVLAAVLVVLLVLVAVVGVVGWRLSRRVRAGSPGRATLRSGALTLRAAVSPPGPRRELAQLRASLNDNVVHTARVLAEAPGSVGLLDDLLGQLQVAAAALDRRLRVMADEPAEGYLSEMLPGMAARVAQLNDDALSLRRSAVELSEDPDTLRRREQDLRDRISGLAQGIRELHGPADPDAAGPLAPPDGPVPQPARPPVPDPHDPAPPGRTTRADDVRDTEGGHSR